MSKIVVVGATGLIGGLVSRGLVSPANDVHILARRKLAVATSGVEQHIADTEQWLQIVAELSPDVAISCLGTTIAKAGSQQAFANIDLDLVVAFAKAAYASGTRHFIAVSSVGASAQSANFYLRTKGETEAALADIGFDTLDIIRPGLLRGARDGERRMGEQIGIGISPFTDLLMQGTLRRYRSIAAKTVADAICALAAFQRPGKHLHQFDSLVGLATGKQPQ